MTEIDVGISGKEPSETLPSSTAGLQTPAADDGPSLKQRAMTGTFWAFFGHGTGEALGLISHLICAYLLGPAVLGIMVMVNVVLHGLRMFSDIGVGASIIQHGRGDEPAFLDTAWTIQIIRGFALFVAAGLLAYPVAAYRHQPQLVLLLPVAAFGAVLDGFSATGPATLHRHLRIRALTVFELTCNFIARTATVICVLIWRDVWALVAGGLIGAVARLIGTHAFLSLGHRNWFRWDHDAVRHLVRFGRWIFIATALTFLCAQGDKLVMAGILTDAELGVYGVAFLLAVAIPRALRAMTNRVLFPLYARISDQSPETLRGKMGRVRVLLLAVILPPLCLLSIFGQTVVDLLYSDEFKGAGWILQILAMGSMIDVVNLTVSPALLARGDSFRHMVVLISRATMLMACMLCGGLVAGQFGIVLGVALAHVLYYPVLAWAVHRHGVWMPRLDVPVMAAAVGVTGLGILWLA